MLRQFSEKLSVREAAGTPADVLLAECCEAVMLDEKITYVEASRRVRLMFPGLVSAYAKKPFHGIQPPACWPGAAAKMY